jgi:DNA modification methylase
MSDRWTLHVGNCLDVMRDMEENSVDSIVTDPPYGLAFMGKRWDYDVPSVEIWAECLRVLKPGGHLLAFAGTRTQHRMAVRIEDGGFEIRDMIAWVYGSGFPKSHNGPWGGTALKPALEPITMARKPLDGTVAANVQEWGTGGLNIDGCRVGMEIICAHGGGVNGDGRKYGGGNGIPAIAAGSNQHSGRWPANLIHDGSEEVVGLFPETASGNLKASPRRKRDGDGWGMATPDYTGDSGSAARFFYCAKASKSDRDEGCEKLGEKYNRGSGTHGNGTSTTRLGNAQERANGITHVELAKVRNNHPTVKPTDLMRYLCRLITPPGGLVFDPFTGSGSTGKAAMLEGFRFVGAELSEEYAEIARARIGHAASRERQKELALS